MAGGDHYAAHRAQIFYRVRNAWRRRRLRREDDLKIIFRKNFGGDLREAVGEKPPVITDDDSGFPSENLRFWIGDFRFPKVCGGLGDAGHIRKGKIFRDDCAPAIRPEFDLIHIRKLQIQARPVIEKTLPGL